jgi:hypothetical protein
MVTVQVSNNIFHHCFKFSRMTDPQPIFCCEHVYITKESKNKPYKDPYSEHHCALYRSFLAFAERRQRAWSLIGVIRGVDSRSLVPLPSNALSLSPIILPHLVLTPEALENIPITPDTQYVIHVINSTRFRLFHVVSILRKPAKPRARLEGDYSGSVVRKWFANGEPFKLKVHKRDFKCLVDSILYWLVLRVNLATRSMLPAIRNG